MSEPAAAYGAYAAHPGLGEEAVLGRIVFERWRLRFESSAAVFEMPLARLDITVERAGDGRIEFRDSQQPDLIVFAFDADILENKILREPPHTRHQVESIQSYGELKRRLKLTAAFLGGFALIALVGSVMMGIMVRSLVARVPPQWEKELGDELVQDVQKHAVMVENAKLKAKLDEAVLPLVTALPTNWGEFKFHIVQDSLPNAFALPGGHVFVNTGLLDMADRPEEVAGVVAHEIAHVTKKHGFRKIISAAGPYLIFKIFAGDRSGVLGILGAGSQLLVTQSFSQEYELEADSVGWDYLVEARIDPRGSIDILRKFKFMQENMLAGELRIAALESHPATEKRIVRLEKKWEKLKDKTGFMELSRSEWK